MKINTPVTRNEVFLQPGKPIVSKTDLKGTITYVNQSFIDISGFSREELLGQNHNIVRHPDMPPEAFDWLWRTIKKGLPWRGLVKNRCKNGDFYWVEAYVTPIRENGKITGYMSVRNAPARNEVNDAEKFYADIRAGKASTPEDKTTFQDISLFTKLNLIFTCMFIMLGGGSAYYFFQASTGLDYLVASITGAGTLITIAASLWIRRMMKKFLHTTIDALEKIAEGNFAFTVGAASHDELGMVLHALESTRINLRAIISDVSIAAKNVDSNSKQVAREMANLLQRTTDQSDRTNSISAATEEMHQSITQAGILTQEAASLSSDSAAIIAQGNEYMNQSVKSVEQIVKVVSDSRTALLNLNDAIQRIGHISETIKDVAEQTNLLALNAAIEAARAGEQGRGFAVVADEVRKLAERTTSSTQDISKTLESIRGITQDAVYTMNKAEQEVSSSTKIIQDSRRNLDEILLASNKSKQMSSEITLMLKEQMQATEDISRNMNDIYSLASRNMQSVENTNTAFQYLALTANELDALIGHFEKSL